MHWNRFDIIIVTLFLDQQTHIAEFDNIIVPFEITGQISYELHVESVLRNTGF
jgi:hypothetical protein